MQNATLLSQPHTDEAPLYKVEVIYDDNSKKSLIYGITLVNKGRFYMNDMYSLNEEAIPPLIELFESYKEVRSLLHNTSKFLAVFVNFVVFTLKFYCSTFWHRRLWCLVSVEPMKAFIL